MAFCRLGYFYLVLSIEASIWLGHSVLQTQFLVCIYYLLLLRHFNFYFLCHRLVCTFTIIRLLYYRYITKINKIHPEEASTLAAHAELGRLSSLYVFDSSAHKQPGDQPVS